LDQPSLSLGIALCGEHASAQTASWRVDSVTLAIASGTLAGSLTLPTTTRPVPLAIIIAGSGPTDRNGNTAGAPSGPDAYRLLAEQLASRGIASLRYDKRGVAGSRAAATSERQVTFDDFANDAVGWIQQYRADRRFSSIVVIGHSEGSLLGMLAVQRARADGYISLAGPARRADLVIHEQLALQLPRAMLEQSDSVFAALVRGDTVATYPPQLQALFRPSVQPYLISWLRYNGADDIAHVRVPTLILQGTHDNQVKVIEADQLAKALPTARLVKIDGMNHVLKLTSAIIAEQQRSYSDPSLPVAPALVSAIADFIRSLPTARSGPPPA
jgi:pimeloyl-ACP methyl ester carboxylesterase